MVDAAALRHTGRAVHLSPEAVARSLDPECGVAARTASGGPSPALVLAQVLVQRADLDSAKSDVDAMRERVGMDRAALKRAVAELARLSAP